MITRRQWMRGSMGGALGFAACSRKHATGFPGLAIVANEAENNLSAVSLQLFRVIRQLRLEAAPSQVITVPNPERVLCLLPSRGVLVAVDAEAVAVRNRVKVAEESLSMRVDDDGKRVWVLNKSPNTLAAIDLASFQTVAKVQLPGTPASLDLHGKMGAVSLPGQKGIAIIEDNRVSRTIATSIAPEMICFRPDGGIVMAGDPEEQMLAVADPATGHLLVMLPLPLKPRHYCYKGDGGQLFITGDGMDAVTIVSPYRTEVFETVLAGHTPAGMAAAGSANQPEYLFITNSGSGDLTVMDIFSRGIVARIHVGEDPQDVVVTPDLQYALVLNRKSGDIAVIRVPSIGAFKSERTLPGWLRRAESASLFTMIPVGLRPVSAAITRVA